LDQPGRCKKMADDDKGTKTEQKSDGAVACPPVFGMRPETGRWLYIIIGLVMNICLGTVYSWSVFTGDLKTFFAAGGQTLTAIQLNMPFLVFLAFFAILMPIAGKFFNKYNPKIILLIGSVLVGVGWLLAGFAITEVVALKENSFTLLVIAYGVVAGGGVGIVYGGPIACSTRWCPDRKGFAVGSTVLGFGVSAAITAPLATYLINTYSVPDAFLILGGTFLVILVLLSLVVSFPPAGWMPKGCTLASTSGGRPSINTTAMLKTPSFYALWFCFWVGSLAGLMAIGISKPMGMDYIGLNKNDASLAIIAFAIPNGLGRPLFGWLTDRLTPRYAAMLSFVLILVGSLGMLPAGNTGLGMSVRVICFIFSFCCLWMCLGGWLAIAPTSTTTFFGPKNQPNNYGIVFSAYGIGAIAGNLLSGYVKDNFVSETIAGKIVANAHPGAYMIIFYATIVLALVGMLIAFFLMKPPKAAEQPAPAPEKKEQTQN